MFIGPITFQNLNKIMDQYNLEQKRKKELKENFGEVQPANVQPTGLGGAIVGAGIFLIVLYLFFVTMWIWNIVLIAMYWNRMSTFARVMGIIGVVSGVFAPVSVLVTYLTMKSNHFDHV